MFDVEIPIEHGLDGYSKFIRCKMMPRYEVKGRSVWTDRQSYATIFDAPPIHALDAVGDHLFDYQRSVVASALKMERFGAFLDCGLGKSHIEMAWAHAVSKVGRVLFLCPLSVMEDLQRISERFYGHRMRDLRRGESWDDEIGILNWESRREIDMRGVAGIVLDESSVLKQGDGITRKWLTDLAKSVRFRLACSATPSPNEQAEYATHAVFLGYVSTLNTFYGQWFKKDGTQWRLKRHAVEPFYRNLRKWCCYIQRPSVLGFDSRAEMAEDPIYRIIDTSAPKYRATGHLFTTDVSLRESQQVFGALRSDTSQPRFRDACDAIGDDRSIVWCSRNAEQDAFHKDLGGHSINGQTPIEQRVDMIDDFRCGRVNRLLSKPSILGFGVNLPEADSHLFSGYTWSFEQFYQAVRRSHRFGRNGRLSVVVPLTERETPIWHSLKAKMATFDSDVGKLQELMRGDG
ncbi:MAG: DEAD/DEAH box helicase [Candidatus Uhrbacteria bacterium]|nr:DEAD/DEAH box helicase [Candidatus Uhrbacteria bacterium]